VLIGVDSFVRNNQMCGAAAIRSRYGPSQFGGRSAENGSPMPSTMISLFDLFNQGLFSRARGYRFGQVSASSSCRSNCLMAENMSRPAGASAPRIQKRFSALLNVESQNARLHTHRFTSFTSNHSLLCDLAPHRAGEVRPFSRSRTSSRTLRNVVLR